MNNDKSNFKDYVWIVEMFCKFEKLEEKVLNNNMLVVVDLLIRKSVLF